MLSETYDVIGTVTIRFSQPYPAGTSHRSIIIEHFNLPGITQVILKISGWWNPGWFSNAVKYFIGGSNHPLSHMQTFRIVTPMKALTETFVKIEGPF